MARRTMVDGLGAARSGWIVGLEARSGGCGGVAIKNNGLALRCGRSGGVDRRRDMVVNGGSALKSCYEMDQ
ncbi:unnamed protein product [Dovyalis caffra]|uniref:Uncharacterized protein n=1 Tax=Dovyalis caffra TaxID=77055 RepID=A0AAV1RDU6_9ROSI|nr:unnamed protein product [Dovyalis caffra]